MILYVNSCISVALSWIMNKKNLLTWDFQKSGTNSDSHSFLLSISSSMVTRYSVSYQFVPYHCAESIVTFLYDDDESHTSNSALPSNGSAQKHFQIAQQFPLKNIFFLIGNDNPFFKKRQCLDRYFDVSIGGTNVWPDARVQQQCFFLYQVGNLPSYF